MKKSIIAIILLLVSINIYSQKKGETVEPWLDNFERTPFQQAKDGTILIRITNKGTNVDDCIEKAKQQAVYALIFFGYTGANNIPDAPAISPNGASLYNEKIDFFKEFFTNTTLYRSYVPKTDLDPKNPVSEIDRKTVEATIIVTVEVNRLRSDLEKQNIIKSLNDFGFTPTILVVPSNKWMLDNGFVTKGNNQGQETEIFNWLKAVTNDKISGAISTVEGKYSKSKGGPFEVNNIQSKINEINLLIQKNNDRKEKNEKAESEFDIYARKLSADLWIQIDLNKKPLNGLETQLVVTITGLDPYTGKTVINGTPIEKITKGDNEFQLVTNAVNGACDEMRTLIFNYFQNRKNSGIDGFLSFTMSTNDNRDFDFDTSFPNGDKEPLPLAKIFKKILKDLTKERDFDTPPTPTLAIFKAKIDLFYDEDGEAEKNSFYEVASRVKSILETKYGLLSKIQPIGLGNVEIFITGRK